MWWNFRTATPQWKKQWIAQWYGIFLKLGWKLKGKGGKKKNLYIGGGGY